jgi:hypothetical protein
VYEKLKRELDTRIDKVKAEVSELFSQDEARAGLELETSS